MDRAAAFLAGDGRNIVRRYVVANALPRDLVDDLVQNVLEDVWILEVRGQDIVDEEHLKATVALIARRRVIDLVRGRRRRPEGHLIAVSPDGTDPLDAIAAPDRVEERVVAVTVAGSMVDDLRRGLLARLLGYPSRAAGALAVLAIVHGDARPAADCPRPGPGVDPAAAVPWAGVFYGGTEGCFPTEGQPEDPAMRKRRSRAIERQQAVLREVAEDVGAILEDDDG